MKALLRAPYSLGWLCGGPLWALHTAIASLRLRNVINVVDRALNIHLADPASVHAHTYLHSRDPVGDGPSAAAVDANVLELVPCPWAELVGSALEITEPLSLALVQSGHVNASVVAELAQESPRAQLTRLESPLWLYELLTDEGRRVRTALQALGARTPEWHLPYPKTTITLLAFAIRGTLHVS